MFSFRCAPLFFLASEWASFIIILGGECWGSLLLLGYFSFWHVGDGSPFGFGSLYLCTSCNFYEVLRTYVLLIPTLIFLNMCRIFVWSETNSLMFLEVLHLFISIR